jgi:hypothetical protein
MPARAGTESMRTFALWRGLGLADNLLPNKIDKMIWGFPRAITYCKGVPRRQ